MNVASLPHYNLVNVITDASFVNSWLAILYFPIQIHFSCKSFTSILSWICEHPKREATALIIFVMIDVSYDPVNPHWSIMVQFIPGCGDREDNYNTPA